MAFWLEAPSRVVEVQTHGILDRAASTLACAIGYCGVHVGASTLDLTARVRAMSTSSHRDFDAAYCSRFRGRELHPRTAWEDVGSLGAEVAEGGCIGVAGGVVWARVAIYGGSR